MHNQSGLTKEILYSTTIFSNAVFSRNAKLSSFAVRNANAMWSLDIKLLSKTFLFVVKHHGGLSTP
jgi:hypothetical protein